jgi:hypothetical protein
MKEIALVALVLTVLFSGLSFSQQTEKTTAPSGVFAYASNSRQVIVIDKDTDESKARILTRAFCHGYPTMSAVSLAAISKGHSEGAAGFQYVADSVPANSYCFLVDSKTSEELRLWGYAESPVVVHEKRCLDDIARNAKALTGREAASCYLIGVYGTAKLELLEFVSKSPDDQLAVLMVIDDSMAKGQRYSIARFPAGDRVWTTDNDGKFHPERFRHLFTLIDDPDAERSWVAIEWCGPAGNDLILYQPVGSELKPVIISNDSSHGGTSEPAELASR